VPYFHVATGPPHFQLSFSAVASAKTLHSSSTDKTDQLVGLMSHLNFLLLAAMIC